MKIQKVFNPNYFAVGQQIVIAGIPLELAHYRGSYYLLDLRTCSGASVFYALGISDKDAFCSKYYGYQVNCGCDFPRTVFNDHSGIGKLVSALLKKSETMGFLQGRKIFSSSASLTQGRLKYYDWVSFGHFGVYFVDIDIESKGFFLNNGKKDFLSIFDDLGLHASDFLCNHYGYQPLSDVMATKPGDYKALNKSLIALFKEKEKLFTKKM